jgi:hypothetical protein
VVQAVALLTADERRVGGQRRVDVVRRDASRAARTNVLDMDDSARSTTVVTRLFGNNSGLGRLLVDHGNAVYVADKVTHGVALGRQTLAVPPRHDHLVG